MKLQPILLFFFLTLFAVGCAAPTPALTPTPALAPTAVPTPGTAGPTKSGTLRVAVPASSTVRNIPALIALELLQAHGYTVEQIPIDRFDLIPEALNKGDADFGSVSPQGGWAAIGKGAALTSIVAQFGPTWGIVAGDQVKTCADLAAVPVAFSTTTGVNQTMLADYAKQTCGVIPQIIVAGDSKSRMAALLANRIDAASLELEDRLQLDRDAPGRYHTVLDSSKEFPNLLISVYMVPRTYAEKNPEIVKDFIRALLTANRRVQNDPQFLRAEIAKQFQYDAEKSKRLADAYLAANVWNPNGGITTENLQQTLEFLKKTNALSGELQASDLADLSYLNAVLDEIGHKCSRRNQFTCSKFP